MLLHNPVERHYSTIIISFEAWKFLRNEDRQKANVPLLSDELLQKSWNRMKYRNQGAGKDYPISDNEIRIYKDSTLFDMETVKRKLIENGFTYREDGFILDCIEL